MDWSFMERFAPLYVQAAVFIYGVVFLMYFMVCWPISLLAGRLEKRWKE